MGSLPVESACFFQGRRQGWLGFGRNKKSTDDLVNAQEMRRECWPTWHSCTKMVRHFVQGAEEAFRVQCAANAVLFPLTFGLSSGKGGATFFWHKPGTLPTRNASGDKKVLLGGRHPHRMCIFFGKIIMGSKWGYDPKLKVYIYLKHSCVLG